MTKKQVNKPDFVDEKASQASLDELETLKKSVSSEKEKAARAIADYQNLERRSNEDRLRFIKMANLDFCLAILQPLEHLSLAAAQIQDPGLDMVIAQLWKQLNNFGLEKIEVLGQKFDLATMEAVESKGKGETVKQVVRNGYRLNGQVIQHAQVILA